MSCCQMILRVCLPFLCQLQCLLLLSALAVVHLSTRLLRNHQQLHFESLLNVQHDHHLACKTRLDRTPVL